MYVFIALLEIAILAIFLIYQGKKYGLTLLGDNGKLMMMLWLSTLSLYNLTLSTLYSPNININIIVLLIIIPFFFLGRKISLEEKDVIKLLDDINDEDKYRKYFLVSNIILIIGVITFGLNVWKYGLAILEENKINKQGMTHYSAYIVYMLALCAQIKYVLFRINKRVMDLIGFIASIAVLILTLNRGPIAFVFITIYIYELFNLIKIKDSISKKKRYITYGVMIFGILLFIQFFGIIGNMRMDYVLNNILHKTINEHYGVSEYMPSGFLWVYIYITSPLENAAFALGSQVVQYTYFNNLFYPFIKLFANIIGQGDAYKGWIMERAAYEPYLDEKVGLNVLSFITESMQDLGYIGLIVYVAIYVLIAYLSIKLIKKRKMFSSIGSIIIYSNILNILLWSVFVNSLKIPILILNIFLILFIEFVVFKEGRDKWIKRFR